MHVAVVENVSQPKKQWQRSMPGMAIADANTSSKHKDVFVAWILVCIICMDLSEIHADDFYLGHITGCCLI